MNPCNDWIKLLGGSLKSATGRVSAAVLYVSEQKTQIYDIIDYNLAVSTSFLSQ